MEEETLVYKSENVLSLLQSRVGGSLDSSLDAIALGLREGFVVKVAQIWFGFPNG